MATEFEQAKSQGFGRLPCVKCGEVCIISIAMDDLSTLVCSECGNDYPITDVEDVIAKLAAVIAWVKAAPMRAKEVGE